MALLSVTSTISAENLGARFHAVRNHGVETLSIATLQKQPTAGSRMVQGQRSADAQAGAGDQDGLRIKSLGVSGLAHCDHSAMTWTAAQTGYAIMMF